MKRSNRSGKSMVREDNGIAWELRPGGMLVQKRSDAAGGPSGPFIQIKVTHGSYQHDLSILAQSTFGELKRVLAQETGLAPSEQRLLFRGKEKDDGECLHMAGIKEMSKVVLLEDPASKEQKLERMRRDQGMLRACEAVAAVRAEVDKLAVKVSNLEASVHVGAKAADKEFSLLTELLMVQLLKLDSIEAQGEAKVQRRFEALNAYLMNSCTFKRWQKNSSVNFWIIRSLKFNEWFREGDGMVNKRTIGNCENWFVIYPSEPFSHTSSTDMLLHLKSYDADSADAWKLDQLIKTIQVKT